MIEEVHLKETDDSKVQVSQLQARLSKSFEVNKRMQASRKIYLVVLSWYKVLREKKRLIEALIAAKKMEDEKNKHNAEDDLFQY